MDAKRPKSLVSRAKIGLCVPTNGDDSQLRESTCWFTTPRKVHGIGK